MAKRLTKSERASIIFRLYALFMSRYCILEGRKALEVLPSNNPLSDICAMGFAIPATMLMHQAFGEKNKLREKADNVLEELVGQEVRGNGTGKNY